jgi:hypothetical protein
MNAYTMTPPHRYSLTAYRLPSASDARLAAPLSPR